MLVKQSLDFIFVYLFFWYSISPIFKQTFTQAGDVHDFIGVASFQNVHVSAFGI